jgi:hypothetical protein
LAAFSSPVKKRLSSEVHRYFTLCTSSAMVYGHGSAFSFNLVPPPSDSKVDRRSLFSWHFEALRRAMLESKAELAQALRDRRRAPSSIPTGRVSRHALPPKGLPMPDPNVPSAWEKCPKRRNVHSALDFWSSRREDPPSRHCDLSLCGSRGFPMHRPCRSIRAIALVVALVPSILACVGPPHTVAPAISGRHQRLGEVRSEACGSLVLGVIPAALNSRVARAYAQALAQRTGATALVDVTLTERWFYWVFGTTRCATISGVAVK